MSDKSLGRPAARLLRIRVLPHEGNDSLAERTVHMLVPDFGPLNATDRAHDVNLDRQYVHLDQATAIGDRLGSQLWGGKPNALSIQQPLGVVEASAAPTRSRSPVNRGAP
jgi:hypothetical protein